MSMEERFTEVILGDEEKEEEEEVDAEVSGRYERRHQRLGEKNKAAVDRFLGKGQRVNDAGIFPKYYGELLTWALKRYMEEKGWQVAQTLGYHQAVR